MHNSKINSDKIKPKNLNINGTNKLHMEQRLYKYEIVLNLLKSENHLRKISREIGVNHMTVKRKLDILLNQGVLDIKQEGKNNIFSIKRTLEARNIIFISELYKLDNFIKKHAELKQALSELKKLPANLILIFGSYSSGIETKNSDLDVYIETENNKLKDIAERINSKFSVKIGKYDGKNLLMKEIEKNHIIVKGVEEFYEKNKFFE